MDDRDSLLRGINSDSILRGLKEKGEKCTGRGRDEPLHHMDLTTH